MASRSYSNPLAPVTVVIPYYNARDLIVRALRSVGRQTLPPREVILVDDGSSEPLEVMTRELRQACPDSVVRVIRKENGGPSSARNLGVSLATEEFIAFLDADDEMVNGNLAGKVPVLQGLTADYFGVYGAVSDEAGGGQQLCSFDGLMDVSQIGRENGFPGGSCAYLFRKTALQDVGGFDENLVNHEDFDLLIRLTRQGYKCSGPYGAAILQYRQAVSVSRPADPYVGFNLSNRFFRKAEVNAYFTDDELFRRQETARRKLAKGLFRNRRLVEAAREFDITFTRLPPKRLTEYLMFLWAKMTLLVVRK